jgi:hypothetical protein
MTTSQDRYPIPSEGKQWDVSGDFVSTLRWEYKDGRSGLENLYSKAKKLQWNADDRIDWSLDLDPENLMEMPDVVAPLFGSPVWNKMTEKERTEYRVHQQAWQNSQFLHGEQGADRRPCPGRLPRHSRHGEEQPRLPGECLCHAGRGLTRRLRSPLPTRLLPAAVGQGTRRA